MKFLTELTEEFNGTTSDDKFILNVLTKNDEQLTKLMDKTVNFKRLQLLADFHRKLKSRRNKSDVILYAIEKVENCPVYTKVRKTTKVETFVERLLEVHDKLLPKHVAKLLHNLDWEFTRELVDKTQTKNKKLRKVVASWFGEMLRLVKTKTDAQEMLEIGNSFNFKSLKFNDLINEDESINVFMSLTFLKDNSALSKCPIKDVNLSLNFLGLVDENSKKNLELLKLGVIEKPDKSVEKEDLEVSKKRREFDEDLGLKISTADNLHSLITTVDQVTVTPITKEFVKNVTPNHVNILKLSDEERLGKVVTFYNQPQSLSETKDRLNSKVTANLKRRSAVTDYEKRELIFDSLFKAIINQENSRVELFTPSFRFSSTLLEYRVIQDVRKIKPDLVDELLLLKSEIFNEINPTSIGVTLDKEAFIDLQSLDDWSKVRLIVKSVDNPCQLVDIIHQLKGVEPEISYPSIVESTLLELFNRKWRKHLRHFVIKCFYKMWELTKLPEFNAEKIKWFNDWWVHDLMRWHLGLDDQVKESFKRVVLFHVQEDSARFDELIIHFLKWLVESEDGRELVIDELSSLSKKLIRYSDDRVQLLLQLNEEIFEMGLKADLINPIDLDPLITGRTLSRV